MVQRISRAFKDISLSFDRHPVTNDILNIKNEDAIKKAVRNIVQTVPSERFFNPIFGSDVKTSLFEFVDLGTARELKTAEHFYTGEISEMPNFERSAVQT